MQAQTLRIAAIAGPTAAGKSALALRLHAAGLPVELVNCDALLVYRGLDAGTAKQDATERAQLPIHLLDVVEPHEAMTAGRWADLARPLLAEIAARGRIPLLVGGTGLYLRALLRGLAPIPPVDPQLRAELEQRFRELGALAMHAELAALDPEYAAQTPPANRQRVLRALEVALGTGKAFSQWHREHQAQPPAFRCLMAVLQPERAWLMGRIDRRAAAMAEPLLAEVAQLVAAGVDPAAPGMQALGYRDAALVATGQAEAAGFAQRLAQAHRQYAKRQQTWFAAEPADLRLDSAQLDPLPAVQQALQHHFSLGL
ncbi:MAG: tRNA (adenosine(37)-N6)-dimethylallyltransferase MiaA [Deltaproteobacteria bacterium]|nr:tRNA (adenosine(37)-N6)-dimethylallyltransferase MiaA [Deltaproteobacteria bacterium]